MFQIFIIVGTIGTAIAGGSLGVSVYGVIIFWRFIMGVGIGGDYPVSSVITSEFAARRIRGRMMAAVFSAQGWGNREYLHWPLKGHADNQLLPVSYPSSPLLLSSQRSSASLSTTSKESTKHGEPSSVSDVFPPSSLYTSD